MSDSSQELDLDRLESEASKVFALWEIMAADAVESHPAAAPASPSSEAECDEHRAWGLPTAAEAMQLGAMAQAASVPPTEPYAADSIPAGVGQSGTAVALETAQKNARSSAPGQGSTAPVVVATGDETSASEPKTAALQGSERLDDRPLNLVPFPEPAKPVYVVSEAQPMALPSGGARLWLAALSALAVMGAAGLWWVARDSAGAPAMVAPAASPNAAQAGSPGARPVTAEPGVEGSSPASPRTSPAPEPSSRETSSSASLRREAPAPEVPAPEVLSRETPLETSAELTSPATGSTAPESVLASPEPTGRSDPFEEASRHVGRPSAPAALASGDEPRARARPQARERAAGSLGRPAERPRPATTIRPRERTPRGVFVTDNPYGD